MIVDNDVEIRGVLQAILEDEGYATQAACDGADALRQMNASGSLPCAILTDVMMPVMNGREFLLALAANQQWAGIPCVVMSATHTAIPGGAPLALPKPFTPEQLLATLRKVCPMASFKDRSCAERHVAA